ncbi:hypothetical protein [Streptomyces coeruleorubidus]|uniref:Uncharacterized protein n=1 Tax=Streptomyces coeruleorubidus TaxID=116188 RepID=A0ABZ0K915_STRC4|nr:hypothetical protein [Streptomyces coeruleorubidus]WOT34297.1 hypothetical protein R5U08_09170 [Streptomyces coeruleorubidus]
MNESIVQRHWLAIAAPKAAPALATTTVLALARIWNANGAEHSVGNAVLMTALSIGAAAAGACASVGRAGDSTIAGTAFAASGALAFAGVAGYADARRRQHDCRDRVRRLRRPRLRRGRRIRRRAPAAAAAVVGGHRGAYGLAARYWRKDRRETVAYERHVSDRREERAHLERVETLRASTQIEVARTGAAYTEQLAQALVTRAALPGFDPKALGAAGLPELPAAREER